MSSKTNENLTPLEMRDRAIVWYDRQIEILKMAHGASWDWSRDWIEDYLKSEMRQRLLDLGWRPKP